MPRTMSDRGSAGGRSPHLEFQNKSDGEKIMKDSRGKSADSVNGQESNAFLKSNKRS